MDFEHLKKSVLIGVFSLVGLGLSLAEEVREVNGNAARYYQLLLKKPDHGVVFGRFIDAWVGSWSEEGLQRWLGNKAAKRPAEAWKVLGAFYQNLGENEEVFWEILTGYIALNEESGYQVALEALRESFGAKGPRRLSHRGRELSAADQSLKALLRMLQRGKSQLSIPQQVRLLDHIYRSELGDVLLEPVALDPRNSDWLWDQFVKIDKKAQVMKKVPPLSGWLRELDAGQEAVFAVFLSSGLLRSGISDFNRLDRVVKQQATESPILFDLVRMARDYRNWGNRKHEKRLVSARRHYQEILKQDILPVVLKVELLSRVNRRSHSLNFGGSVLDDVLEISFSYIKSGQNLSDSSLIETIRTLSLIDSDHLLKGGEDLVKLFHEHLLSEEVLGAASEGEKLSIKQGAVRLFLKVGRSDLAKEVLRENYAIYRGELELIMLLAELGEFETLRKLIALNTGNYNRLRVSDYDQDFHSLAARILEEVPKHQKYHLEVVFADRDDPAPEKESSHEVSREARIVKLASEFSEKGSGLSGDASLEVLAIFAAYEASALFVEDELRDLFQQTSLLDGVTLDKAPKSGMRDERFEVLERIMRMDIKAKKFAPAREKIIELQKVLARSKYRIWKLRYHIDDIFGMVAQELVAVALRDPDDAAAVFEEAKTYFDLAVKIKSESIPLNVFDGTGLIISSLMGKSEEWKNYLENHPEKERYESVRKKREGKEIFRYLVSDHWLDERGRGSRAKVLRALFDSSYYKEREISHVHDFRGLSDAKLFTFREFVDGARALPEGHPMKPVALFRVAGLETYQFNKKFLKEGIRTYGEALRLAREMGDEVLANQILAHRCDVNYRHERKEAAKRDALRVKLKLLPERDYQWVKRSMAIWLKDTSE